jgi:hypothetical protein
MESRISQQPLVGSYSILKLTLMGSNQSVKSYKMKRTSKGRKPPMEDEKLNISDTAGLIFQWKTTKTKGTTNKFKRSISLIACLQCLCGF